jgi:hypothetical protein
MASPDRMQRGQEIDGLTVERIVIDRCGNQRPTVTDDHSSAAEALGKNLVDSLRGVASPSRDRAKPGRRPDPGRLLVTRESLQLGQSSRDLALGELLHQAVQLIARLRHACHRTFGRRLIPSAARGRPLSQQAAATRCCRASDRRVAPRGRVVNAGPVTDQPVTDCANRVFPTTGPARWRCLSRCLRSRPASTRLVRTGRTRWCRRPQPLLRRELRPRRGGRTGRHGFGRGSFMSWNHRFGPLDRGSTRSSEPCAS